MICAGGALMLLNAWVSISVLRRVLGCTLPIEVWHLGAEEMSATVADQLSSLDVTIVDAHHVMREKPARIVDGWQLKAYALLYARFAEVLLLDADQVCVGDPAALFDAEDYIATGALFWPDIVDLKTDAAIWRETGIAPRSMASFESGQLLVDKRRHWSSLQLALAINEDAERFYKLVYGDKDTFLLAWLLEEASFHLVVRRPAITTYGLLQYGPNGTPMFQHRTQAKWKYAGDQLLIDGFAHEAACLHAIDEIRKLWSGRIFHPPARSMRARACEADLVGGTLLLSRAGSDDKTITLLRNGEIGVGRNGMRQNWHCDELADRRLALALHSGSRVTMRFARDGEGRWIEIEPDLVTPSVAVLHGRNEDAPPARTLLDGLLDAAGFPERDPAEDARLRAALELIAEVEPAIVEELDRKAAMDPRLSALAGLIPRTARRKLRSGAALLSEEYQSIFNLQ